MQAYDPIHNAPHSITAHHLQHH